MASCNEDVQRVGQMHTSYPGHVYNFDPDTQMCEVRLAIDTLFVGMKQAYTFAGKKNLRNVPVQFIQGGGWMFTHGVPDGTPCYVMFAMRGIDHWLAEDKAAPEPIGDGLPGPAYSQLYSHNSAVCIIGLQPIPRIIPEFVNSGMEIRNAERSIRISLQDSGALVVAGSSTISISKDGDISVKTDTQATITAPKITLDGDTVVTKSLTVQGGMAVYGATGGSTMSITGNISQVGSYTINGIRVDGHTHTDNHGGDTGEMK